MDLKLLLAASVTVIGFCLLIAGVAMIYVPAAFVIAGASLVAAGVLPNWGF